MNTTSGATPAGVLDEVARQRLHNWVRGTALRAATGRPPRTRRYRRRRATAGAPDPGSIPGWSTTGGVRVTAPRTSPPARPHSKERSCNSRSTSGTPSTSASGASATSPHEADSYDPANVVAAQMVSARLEDDGEGDRLRGRRRCAGDRSQPGPGTHRPRPVMQPVASTNTALDPSTLDSSTHRPRGCPWSTIPSRGEAGRLGTPGATPRSPRLMGRRLPSTGHGPSWGRVVAELTCERGGAQLKSYGFELGDEAGPRRRPMRSEPPRSRHFARPFAITGQRRCAPVSRGTREGTRGFHGCRGQPRRRGFLTSPDHSGRCYERRTS